MFYAVRYAYGRRAINHGVQADRLHAFGNRTNRDDYVDHDPERREGLTRREVLKLFGSVALADAQANGAADTHVCDGRCR
jgi:hypothetical protein